MKIPDYSQSAGIDGSQYGFLGFGLTRYSPECFPIGCINHLKHGAHAFPHHILNPDNFSFSFVELTGMFL